MIAESGQKKRLILLTGATGYVGGRLLRVLEERGEWVRCLVRRPEVMGSRVDGCTEVVQGDVMDPASLARAFVGVDTAYYLVHSLGSRGDFEREELEQARNFGTAAEAAGVRRVIYLGGLCPPDAPLSRHLRSRLAVGAELRIYSFQLIEFRASIIIGSGSLSFELIRSLVRRLPVMLGPRWFNQRAQPIAISDVLDYLTQALDLASEEDKVYEIGGADRMSYGELVRCYARMRKLHRIVIPVPVLTPRISSFWLGVFTPLYARIGRKLIDSMTTPSVVHDDAALRDFDIRPMGVQDAIGHARRNENREFAETHWADALSSMPGRHYGGVVYGTRIVDVRTADVDLPPEAAFAPVRRIGGRTGFYYGDWLWKLRGLMDRAVGGVGMDRGRRDAGELRLGDVVDCWRVQDYDPPNRLVLWAEMKLPGRAWLEFQVEPTAQGSRICQTAQYDPNGLFGILYWYALWPVHGLVFRGMIRNIAREAKRRHHPATSSCTD